MAKLIRRFEVDTQGATLIGGGRGTAGQGLLVTTGRQILFQSLADGATRVVGDGYDLPAGIVASGDGQTLFVADLDLPGRQFVLYQAAMDKADRAHAKVILRAPGQPMQLALSGTTLYYADRRGGSVVAVDIAGRKRTPVATGLSAPVGVLSDGKRLLISENGAGRIVSVSPGDNSTTVERMGLVAPQYLTAGPLVPRAGTAGWYGTTGVGPDLYAGAQEAVRAMVAHLAEEYGLSREDAYVLCSLAVDLRISEIVDAGQYVVSALLPLSLFG